MFFRRFSQIVSAVLLFATAIGPLAVHATGGYEANVHKKEVSVSMTQGGWRTVTLTYTNTGSKTWKRDAAKGYVSLYVLDKDTSAIRGEGWRADDSPAKITEASVAPGKTGTVSFRVYGNKEGSFTYTFRLAAEDVAWMRGSETTVKVKVGKSLDGTTVPPTSTTPVPAPAPVPPPTSASSSGVSTMLLLRSARELTLAGSERVQVTLGFKNTGTTAWNSRGLKLADLFPASTDVNTMLRDDRWRSGGEAVHEDTVTNPGEIGFLSFWVKAPARKGTYRASFQLEADGKTVDGGLVDIPLTVTADGVFVTTPPITAPDQSTVPVLAPGEIPQSVKFLPNEPILRVGIFATTDDQTILSAPAPFRVQQNGETICSFTAGEQVTMRFERSTKTYRATGPRCTAQSPNFYQVQRTDDLLAPLTMVDFSRPVSWLPGANDNTFRSIIELRWSEKTDEIWVINELPLELYLRGLAETSDVSPIEYQKALLTGARTYAFYHWTRATKHAAEHFHVDAKYDQVYRGYGAEARSPKIVQAVNDTRGQIVTYNNELAITPYFSRSDGRTRNWNEVWGGSGYPWLVSVPVPQDNGKTLWGHGVGLSASGALGMANEGSLYQDILKHFYTGISLLRYY